MMILEFLQKAGRLLCLWGGTALSILLAGLVFLLLQMVSDGVDWILKPRGRRAREL